MSAKFLPIAFLLAATPALADSDVWIADAPYCGDLDGISKGMATSACIPWDGDIEAQPDLGPWQPSPEGVRPFPGMNVVVLRDDEIVSGKALLAISRMMFGEGEAVAIRVAATPQPEPASYRERKTLFGDGGTPARWCEQWWCKRHASAPGQDEDRADRSEPDRAEPTPSEPPARSEPPTRSESPSAPSEPATPNCPRD